MKFFCVLALFSLPQTKPFYLFGFISEFAFVFGKFLKIILINHLKKRFNSFFGYKIALEIAQVLRVHGNLPILI